MPGFAPAAQAFGLLQDSLNAARARKLAEYEAVANNEYRNAMLSLEQQMQPYKIAQAQANVESTKAGTANTQANTDQTKVRTEQLPAELNMREFESFIHRYNAGEPLNSAVGSITDSGARQKVIDAFTAREQLGMGANRDASKAPQAGTPQTPQATTPAIPQVAPSVGGAAPQAAGGPSLDVTRMITQGTPIAAAPEVTAPMQSNAPSNTAAASAAPTPAAGAPIAVGAPTEPTPEQRALFGLPAALEMQLQERLSIQGDRRVRQQQAQSRIDQGWDRIKEIGRHNLMTEKGLADYRTKTQAARELHDAAIEKLGWARVTVSQRNAATAEGNLAVRRNLAKLAGDRMNSVDENALMNAYRTLTSSQREYESLSERISKDLAKAQETANAEEGLVSDQQRIEARAQVAKLQDQLATAQAQSKSASDMLNDDETGKPGIRTMMETIADAKAGRLAGRAQAGVATGGKPGAAPYNPFGVGTGPYELRGKTPQERAAEVRNLPKGTIFKGPDGKLRQVR